MSIAYGAAQHDQQCGLVLSTADTVTASPSLYEMSDGVPLAENIKNVFTLLT